MQASLPTLIKDGRQEIAGQNEHTQDTLRQSDP